MTVELALALVLAAAPAPKAPLEPSAAPAPRPALERQREAVAGEMIRLGARLQREIERADAEALAARIPPDGLRCGGRRVPREHVVRDLRDPRSWLHGVLFGGPGATPAGGGGTAASAGRPASLRALFAQAREIAVAVVFRPDERAGPVGRPCLAFRAPGLVTPGAPFCFERRGERWFFAESLYPCD